MRTTMPGQVATDLVRNRTVIGFVNGELIIDHYKHEDDSDQSETWIRVVTEQGSEVSISQEPSKDGGPKDQLIKVFINL